MLQNIFKKAVILNKEQQNKTKISPYTSYAFAKEAYLVPINIDELIVGSKSLITVFVKDTNGDITPSVLLGTKESNNLLVDEDGKWRENHYIPATLRSYPFGIGENEKDKFLVVDSEATCISEDFGERLFNDDLSTTTQGENSFKFVTEVYNNLELAKQFSKELDSYGLLKHAQLELTKDGEKYTITEGIYIIDENSVNKLESRKIKKLATRGMLKPIYAHLLSLTNKY